MVTKHKAAGRLAVVGKRLRVRKSLACEAGEQILKRERDNAELTRARAGREPGMIPVEQLLGIFRMNRDALAIVAPKFPTTEFLENPSNLLHSADGKAHLAYDPITRSGFICWRESGIWSITAPIDFVSFAIQVRMSGINIPRGSETLRWFERCKSGGCSVLEILNPSRQGQGGDLGVDPFEEIDQ